LQFRPKKNKTACEPSNVRTGTEQNFFMHEHGSNSSIGGELSVAAKKKAAAKPAPKKKAMDKKSGAKKK
jgi:hypothetical protein